MRKLIDHWRGTNDWLKALLIAIVFLGFVHAFVLCWVTVRSSSMYATLYPGDLVGVAKWPLWTGFERGDVAVFRDPMQDDRSMARRQLLVKRIVGMPGDKVEIRSGHLFVNGNRMPDFQKETRSWLLQFKNGMDIPALLRSIGLTPTYEMPGRSEIELPLNDELVTRLRTSPGVVELEPMRLATGSPGNIFPYSPKYPWNSDDFGPVAVPRKGDEIHVDVDNLALYDRLITRYEGNTLWASGKDILLNGAKLDSYTIKQDYYLVLGDSRHYSSDSRYWGFVPADHLVGRASFVLVSNDPVSGDIREGRWFTGIP